MVKRVDRKLKDKKDGVIASSDSEIIDRVNCKIFDLAQKVLETNYKPNLLDLS